MLGDAEAQERRAGEHLAAEIDVDLDLPVPAPDPSDTIPEGMEYLGS